MLTRFTVDQDTCTLCGLCIENCPGSCLIMAGHPTMGNAEACLRCQQCLAICPVGAVSIFGLDPKNSSRVPGNLPELDDMTTLVRGRRACRNYQSRNVDHELVEDLVTSAWHAPTGCNTQQVLFTVISKKEKLRQFFEWIIAELIKVRDLPKFKDVPSLGFIQYVTKEWETKGVDQLFRGAPHFLVASVSDKAVCGNEDAIIALSYFELLANSAGLGTVWDGIAYYAMTTFVPEAKQYLGIPDNHTIGYSMAFGYPAIQFQRTVQRIPPKINFVG